MKTIIILVIAVTLFLPLIVSAETAPRAEWEKNIGGNREDVFYDLTETSDRGYIAVGKTLSLKAYEDLYVVKLDRSGNIEWEKTYGGAKKDIGNSIQQTDDGGYIVGGVTSSFNVGVVDFYILKLDSRGEVQWEKTFGGSQSDTCETIIKTKDGGYLAAGQTWVSFEDGNIYLVKLDSKGNKEWEKMLGGSLEDGANDIQQTPDGGYIIGGHTRSSKDGSYNMFIVKTDSNGNLVWTEEFGGSVDEQGLSIEQAKNGYIAAGHSKSSSSLSDVYVVKVDLKGNKEWEKYYGGTDTLDEAQAIRSTSDGGYIIAGRTSQYSMGANDAMLMKIDQSGNALWTKVFGGENQDIGYSVLQTSDGKFVMAGQTKSIGYGGDGYIVKTETPSSSGSTNVGGDVPDYGSPANGILFSIAAVLLTAGLIFKRR